jgi:CDP-diacylglycerol--serine O-phosphatidyltransferase
MFMRRFVPNFITCLNAVAGTGAVLMVARGATGVAVALVLAAMVFDFFDGLAARLLGVKSDLGRELDSLADAVSFGVAPAMVAYALLEGAGADGWLLFLPVVMPAFSVYRLAKFNLDARQTRSFIGMPTPAHALFWACLWACREYAPGVYAACWGNAAALGACVVVFSVLLVCGLPMFSLKIGSFGWAENRWRYLYFGLAAAGLVVFRWGAVSFLVPLYVVVSAVAALTGRGYQSGV